MNRFGLKTVLLLMMALLVIRPEISSAQEQAVNIAGKWTIYARNVDHAGSSLKTVVIIQNGNIITGKFKGPHQSGKIQGWVTQNHVDLVRTRARYSPSAGISMARTCPACLAFTGSMRSGMQSASANNN